MENAQAHTTPHGNLRSYVTGFILSLLLTAMPFLMVYYGTVHGAALIAAIVLFALLQLGVQLVFFLHLGRGADKRWNIMVFVFMIIVVLTVVIGSLWIMHNLDYHMGPQDMQKQLLKEDDL
jgi:cytochrome o ubiquinol oxidase operon protein cyoD